MVRKFFSAMVFTCLLVFGANICSAGTFQLIYNAEHFTAMLDRDRAVDETFNTNDGKMQLQLRRLADSSDDKRMHVIVKLNDKRIYDEHFPDVWGGYTFRAIKNTVDSRQFYVIESRERAFMIGYSPVNQKMEVYIDSQNYYHDFPAVPYITATVGGDLILAFENSSGNLSVRYRFTWDDAKQWFAYENLGTYRRSITKDMQ